MVDLASLDGLNTIEDGLGNVTQTGRSHRDGNVGPLVSDSGNEKNMSKRLHGAGTRRWHAVDSLVDGADDGGGTASEDLFELALLLVFDQLGHGHVLFRDDEMGRRETFDLDLSRGVFPTDGQDAVVVTPAVIISVYGVR